MPSFARCNTKTKKGACLGALSFVCDNMVCGLKDESPRPEDERGLSRGRAHLSFLEEATLHMFVLKNKKEGVCLYNGNFFKVFLCNSIQITKNFFKNLKIFFLCIFSPDSHIQFFVLLQAKFTY